MTKKKYLCKIYCGQAEYFLESMKDANEKADMVMTDPSSTHDANINMGWLKLCHDVLKEGRVLCSFCSPPTIEDFIKQAEEAGFTHLETFGRTNRRTNKMEPCLVVCKGKCRTRGFVYDDRKYGEDKPVKGFPPEAQKPLSLIKDLIGHFTKEGELVIDFFVGSGTTPLACNELKRNFKGCEISLETAKRARKRLGFKDVYATGL
jgi:DNA modification methylase